MSGEPGRRPLIGLMPAAGRASRLGAGAVSKEILAVGVTTAADGSRRPILACENLLTAFRLAEVTRTLVLRREEKRDIEEALGDGSRYGVPIAQVVVPSTASVPETVDHAWPWIAHADVALGFPDVLAAPVQGLAAAAAHRAATGADLTLALFPTDRPHKCDMVELDAAGRVRTIEIKPARTALFLTWLFATWGPAFSALLHREVAHGDRPAGRELALSDLVLRAVGAGLTVDAVAFHQGSHLDIGTPDDLARAGRWLADRPNGG